MSAPQNASDKPTPAHKFALGRVGRWFGKLIGGSGRRMGSRDTDPGS